MDNLEPLTMIERLGRAQVLRGRVLVADCDDIAEAMRIIRAVNAHNHLMNALLDAAGWLESAAKQHGHDSLVRAAERARAVAAQGWP
jgi:hypothetical protein